MKREVSQDSQELFRLLAENVRDFAVFMTDLQGRLLSWNPGVGRLLGYAEDEWVGRDASVIFTPEDCEQGVPAWEMETALRDGRAEDKRWHVRKDGSRFWADGLLMLLRDGDSPRGFAKILRDDTGAKMAEEKLCGQLALTDAVMGNVLEGIHVLDRVGRITFANPAALDMLGYEADELVGKGQHETVHSIHEDAAPYQNEDCPVVAVLRTGIPLRDYETLYTRKDGSWFSVLCTSAPLVANGEVTGAVMTFHDITRRRLAEARLQESEEQFRTLAQTASDVIVTIDEESRVLFINPAAEKVFGYRPEELTGQSLSLLMPEYLRHQHHAGLTRYMETGHRHISWGGMEQPGLHKDGREVPLELSFGEYRRDGRHVFTGIIRDVTERKRAEAQARESEERFQRLVELSPDAVAVHADGVVLFINTAGVKLLGAEEPSQIVGRPVAELIHPDYHELIRERLENIGRGETPLPVEIKFVRLDGSEIYGELASAPLTYRGGPAVQAVVRDLTFRRRAEAERERLLREAQEANRLKDEFLATVSHELRTPLTAILGWARLLRGGHLERETSTKALETIERSARAQSQLIDDLLDVSRIITGKLRLDLLPIDPVSFIDSAIESVRPASEAKGVHLQKVFESGVGPVMGDPARLQQVVWNLLTNAVKFTPTGGRMQVRLESAGSQVKIVVTDTGAGISSEFLPHVFERFRQADQRTTRQHGGLGLGLAIVRHLVELHGGTVWVDSQGEGQGAAFTVMLPVAPALKAQSTAWRAHPLAHAELPAHRCPERLDGLKVLVVDDEPDARELLTAVLGQCGAEVVTASSAREALDALAAAKFDVLVSDVGMPGEDGYELISRVRTLPTEQGGRTPAVAVTAYARTEDRLRAMRAGFEMHVSKPVELTELIVAIANLASRRGER